MGLTAVRQPLKEDMWVHGILRLRQSMGFIVSVDVNRDVDREPRKNVTVGYL